MNAQTSLAQSLHDNMCRSADWCSGSHAKQWRGAAKAILSADCAATEMHQRVCPAELDSTFPKGCGIDRERHIAFLGEWLKRHGVVA